MEQENKWVASDQAKGQAKQLRLYAAVAWVVAIILEIFVIVKHLWAKSSLTGFIFAVIGILILSVVGSFLWKKANKLDPASEQDKVRFFIQNQLGAIMAVLAFLPLVILIFTDKNANKKTKGIAGAVAIVALLLAGITGTEFSPSSVEQNTQAMQSQPVASGPSKAVANDVQNTALDLNHIYLAKTGTVFHLYRDCPHIKGKEGVTETDLAGAQGKGITQLCKTCELRAEKQYGMSATQIEAAVTAHLKQIPAATEQ